MTNTIIYNGRQYDEETIGSYYDQDIVQQCKEQGNGDAQALFEEYIKLDPEFVELFDYDIDPID